jgi:hypothetical protein
MVEVFDAFFVGLNPNGAAIAERAASIGEQLDRCQHVVQHHGFVHVQLKVSVLTGSKSQGDLGRNALNGFVIVEVDLTVRRQFRLEAWIGLRARADFFNIFNHPNFGPPTNYLSSPLFGQSTQMLGASLGSGGQNGALNPLYQIGGPRSVQLALKLVF